MNRWLRNLSTRLFGHRQAGALDPSQPGSTWPKENDRSAVFEHIHQINHWGDPESLSGPGSTLEYTRNIRAELPRLWSQLGTRVVLDAPCGDYNWFRYIDRAAGIDYIGGDIVESLVRSNQQKYGDAHTRFVRLDIVLDALPDADFWLCRDCLFHLPTSDVLSILRNFAASRIPYLCTSNHPECTLNTDIRPGDFRLINLELPPYNLGKGRAYIEDWIPSYPPRHLVLWHRDDVTRALGDAGS